MVESAADTAYLGLGLMGAPMARRLAEAGRLRAVWNRDPAKAAAFGQTASVAATPAEAVRGAKVVCLCLTDDRAVEAVLFGPAGAAETMSAGTLVVDFSTQGVVSTRAFAARLAERDIAWLDAPVSGGVAGAEAGSLVVFAGGDGPALSQAQDLLGLVSRRVTHMGPVGAGQAAKLCNQLIVSANLVAIAEAMALGARLGMNVTTLPSALEGGFADSTPLRIFGPRMASGVAEPKLGAIGTMLKDVEAICRAAPPGVDLDLLATVRATYQEAERRGWSDQDLSHLARLYS